jgi:hypothetical protein
VRAQSVVGCMECEGCVGQTVICREIPRVSWQAGHNVVSAVTDTGPMAAAISFGTSSFGRSDDMRVECGCITLGSGVKY